MKYISTMFVCLVLLPASNIAYCIFKRFFLLYLLFAFQTVWASQSYKTLLTVDVIRHGDRTPTMTIPKIPHQWHEGLGQLTATGMYQLCQLGKQLRTKLIDQEHLLPDHFNTQSLFVRSTNYDRTLMSANALLNCLYPPHTGPKMETGEFALPEGIQPIPIHTVDKLSDELLLASSAKREEFTKLLEKHVYSQPIWIEKEKQTQANLQKWSAVTGHPLNRLQDIIILGDVLYIFQLHQIPLAIDLDKTEIDEIIALANWALIEKYKPLAIGKFFTKEFWPELKKNINAHINESSTVKSIIYFAHDSTILGFFSGLHIPLSTTPPYAADLRFELLEDAHKQHWVRVSYNGKIQKLPHCNELCTLDQFNYLIA